MELPDTLHPADVLTALERLEADPSAFRKTMARQLEGLSQLLVQAEAAPEGMIYATLGGIYHHLQRLHASFDCLPLHILEERYAQVQLDSYPHSQDELERTCHHYAKQGIEVLKTTCGISYNDEQDTPQKLVVYKITAGRDGRLADGTKVFKGQLLPSVDRKVPQLFDFYRDYL